MVFLSIPNEKTLSIDVNPKSTTISAFEQLIHQHIDVPQHCIRYSLRIMRNPSGVYIEDSTDSDSILLFDLGISRFSTVFIHVPFFGGMQVAALTKPRLDFLNSRPNYVAGLGRGATGFTTPSDIGLSRAAPALPDRSAPAAPGVGRGAVKSSEADEDEEADARESIDQRMDLRRKEIEKYLASNPKITEQFGDLKRKVHTLSADESLRNNKKKKFEIVFQRSGSIKYKIGIGTWIAEADESKMSGSIVTARENYAHTLSLPVFKTDKSIWLKAALLEKSHGSRESLDVLLRTAVKFVPQAEVFWLLGAKEKWLAGDVPAARVILQEAYAAVGNSEEIWLAASKLEFENREPERGRMLLAKARERVGTGRVWMKSAIVERQLGNVEEERKLLDEGLKQFPTFFKLWLMLGQLEERFKNLEQARKAYDTGLRHCPHCIPLWLSLANLQEKVNGLTKARAILTRARKKNPREAELWLAAIRAELRHDNKRETEHLMLTALEECPNSGILLAADIEMAPRPRRKTKSEEALKKCRYDPHVSAAVAKLFWQHKKVEKARWWFQRAVTLAPSIGDIWALYYKFEHQHRSKENQKEVLAKCVASEPKYGEKWQAISKAVENARQPIEAILKKVVIALSKEKKGCLRAQL